MKTFMRFLCAAMLLLSFAACDEKENENDTPGSGDNNSTLAAQLVGTWQSEHIYINDEEVQMQMTIVMNADGTGELAEMNETIGWQVSGNDVNVTNSHGNTFTFTVTDITETYMIITGNTIPGSDQQAKFEGKFLKVNGGTPDTPDPGDLGVSAPVMVENALTSLKMRAQITGDIDTYLSQFPNYSFGFLVSCDAPLSIDHNAFLCTNHEPDGTFTLLLTGLESDKDYMVAAWLKLTPESEPIISNTTIMQTLSNFDPSVYWVDLGLPSGKLWASRNIGANGPLDFGDYFAWGERQPKSTYSWSNYRYGHGSHELTKYCNDPDYGLNGYTDTLTVLEPSDDAALSNPFGYARIPTKTEWEEMVNNTTHVWTTVEGVNGWMFTAPNGNSIFLPAAGDKTTNVNDGNQAGHYWTSSLGTDGPNYAWQLGFTASQLGGDLQTMTRAQRWSGLSVRAVCSPDNK